MNNELNTEFKGQSLLYISNNIENLNNALAEIKTNLATLQAKKASRLDDSLYSPDLYDHYMKVAEMLAKTNMVPTSYRGKAHDIFVAMATGYQLGFPVEQSLNDIAVINGRPCLWGDGLMALALNHPDCLDIKEEAISHNGQVVGWQCTIIRRGHEPHIVTFTINDAKQAGLLKKQGVWQAYPSRMMQLRARAFAIRNKFADALRGFRSAEIEQEDYAILEAQARKADGYKEFKTQTERLKSLLAEDAKSEDSKEIEDANFTDSVGVPQGNGIEVENLRTVEDENSENNQGKSQNAESGETMITEESYMIIEALMSNKNISDERRQKAFEYYGIKKLADLTEEKAQHFIDKLSAS